MTRTENDLRDVLERRAADTPSNADRVEQVHGRIHRNRRHRQVVASGVLALAVAGVAVGLTVPGHGSSASVVPATPSTAVPTQAPSTGSPAPTQAAPTPTVGTVPVGRYGVAALGGYGPVLLDATGGRTAAVAPPEQGATALGLSYDGKYVAIGTTAGKHPTIQQTDLSGHVLQQVATGNLTAAWSPRADVLAVATTGTIGSVVTPHRSASPRILYVTVPGPTAGDPTLAWSPDGSRLAISNGHTLTVVDTAGKVLAQKAFGTTDYPALATWSGDGSHLVVFVHSNSASIDADGVRVVDLDASGHQVGTLPQSLAYPDWWHPLAGAAVLGTVGGDRDVGHGKTVARCDLATAHCATLAGGPVEDAYAGAPTATGIAYLTLAGSIPPIAHASLWLASSDGSGAHPAPGAPATVAQAVASGDGRTLLLVGSDGSGALAVYRYDGTTATRLAAIPAVVAGVGTSTGYYGHVTEIVSWRQPRP